jgi:radical SAM protein with 4Fe4S-binding SPASM domain|tara:strand:+ start:291 stop:1376 length:1086 start_codon:yes stop_codon:yes gene_type:complete
MKFFKKKIYSFALLFFKIRHYFFEIYYRSIFVKKIKKNIKSILPNFLFNYFHKKTLERLLDFPESFSIETVNICNAKCWFCPQPDHKRKKGYMHFDIFKKIIDEISIYKRKVKSIALFMDGDPTLHKELIKFLQYSKEKNIKNIYLSSNMEFFNEKLIDQIFQNKLQGTLKFVIASLDGVSETVHQSNRIGVDTKKAYENTNLLLKKRMENFSFYPWVFPRMLINETNKHEAENFYKYWKYKYKADKVLRTTMHNWGGQIEEKNIHQNKVTFSNICFFPFSQFFIQIDGKARICCLDVNGENIFGDLKKSSIKEIWGKQNFNQLRENLMNDNREKLPKICQSCTYPKKGQWSLPFFWEKSL